MKTFVFPMLLLTLIPGLSNAQNVFIPDFEFLKALIENGVDTNGDRFISYAEAEAVTSINTGQECWGLCEGVAITSFVGIEAFVNLDTLKCFNNQLPSLDISYNTALTYLNCSGNDLESLDISNNTALTYLDCSDMFSLYAVCVWESFPAGVTVSTLDSPFVFFTSECDTNMAPIKHIRFGSTGDPLNGLTVTWKSGGASDSIAWGYTTNLEEGVYHGLKKGGSMFDYTFPSLTAASTIHYALFNSSTWTEEKTFNTASDPSNNQFSFTVLGDSRTNMDQWQIVSEATLDTDFTLFLGDIVEFGGDWSIWAEWFEYGKEFISREPIYNSVGNHEYGDNYLKLFTLPGNELYYSFTFGNAVFICLNSEDPENPEQYNWLLSTLEANKDQAWKFVFFHSPFYTSPSHMGEMDGNFNTWWKAFDDYGVDMIFNGHTHNYQRTKPINRNISTTSPVAEYGSGEGMGRCQIVSGGAGVSLKDAADPSFWWLQESASKHHFCNIDIDGGVLTFKAIDENQDVFDEFTIVKSSPAGTSDFGSTGSWIYPNPTNDLLTVETDKPEHYSIEINSLNGQLLYRSDMDGTSLQIDLSSFQKGLYFITVRSRDYVRTEKIIKF
ncbi:metallophosphoesterase [Bacteroidota bacterium]